MADLEEYDIITLGSEDLKGNDFAEIPFELVCCPSKIVADTKVWI